jgi:hypothetical protein
VKLAGGVGVNNIQNLFWHAERDRPEGSSKDTPDTTDIDRSSLLSNTMLSNHSGMIEHLNRAYPQHSQSQLARIFSRYISTTIGTDDCLGSPGHKAVQSSWYAFQELGVEGVFVAQAFM